jgi:hypothetical protein
VVLAVGGGEPLVVALRLVAGGHRRVEALRAERGEVGPAPALHRGESRLGGGELVARVDQVGVHPAELLDGDAGLVAARQTGPLAQFDDAVLGRLQFGAQRRDPPVEPVVGPAQLVELRLELVGDVELGGEVRDGGRQAAVLRRELHLQHPAAAHNGHDQPVEHRFGHRDLGLLRRRDAGDRGRGDQFGERRKPGPDGIRRRLADPERPGLGAFRVTQPPGEFRPAGQVELTHDAPSDGERADDLDLARQDRVGGLVLQQGGRPAQRRVAVVLPLVHDLGAGGVERRHLPRRDQGDEREQRRADHQHPAPTAQRGEEHADRQPLRLDRGMAEGRSRGRRRGRARLRPSLGR